MKESVFMNEFLTNHRRWKIIINDALCVILGYLIAVVLVHEKTSLPDIIYNKVPIFGLVMVVAYMISFAFFRTDNILWSYANMKNFATLVVACALGAVITYAAEMTINMLFETNINVTLRMNILSFITVIDVILLNRIILKFIREQQHKKTGGKNLPKILLFFLTSKMPYP